MFALLPIMAGGYQIIRVDMSEMRATLTPTTEEA